MNWFRSLKTLKKLLLGFSIVCLIMSAVGAVGIFRLGQLSALTNELYANQLVSLVALHDANIQIVEACSAVRAAALTDDENEVARLKGEMDEQLAILDAQIVKTDGTEMTPEHQEMFEKFRTDVPAWEALVVRAMQERQASQREKSIATLNEAMPLAKQLADQVTELCEAKEAFAEESNRQATETYFYAACTLVGVIAFGVGMAIGIGFFIARIVANPLRQAVGVLQRVAAGDFTAELKVDTKDEIGELAGALNEAVAKIREALLDVRSVAESLASSSQQLASASEEISSGAQEQASSLEQTASSLEEITSTIRQNAENAGQANQLSSGSREVAERGGSVVGNAVAGMKEINAASKKIADIITTIDEIAFQTNLLALNAAVEAARAGEQGRGFAVVAGEVRNLAQRSAGAAKEIKGLIQDSVRKIEAGSELVNQSGQALDEIIGSVKRVTDIVAQISSASREQATGIEQVNKAVSQMDQVTQSNASQTEELSSTAEGLAGQAENLQELVRRFTLEKEATRTSTAAKAMRTPTRVAGKPAPVATKPAAKPKAKTNGHTNGSVNGNGRFHDAWSDSEEGELVGAGAGGSFEEF